MFALKSLLSQALFLLLSASSFPPYPTVSHLLAAPLAQTASTTETDVDGRLSAVVKEIADDRRSLAVTVANHTAKLVTAWAVEVKVTYADGQVSAMWRGVDTAGQDLSGNPDAIRPGGTAETQFYLGERLYDGIIAMDVSVMWAVFEDNSSVGNPARVAEVFSRRAADREVWVSIRAILLGAGRDADGLAALGLAVERLKGQPDSNHPEKRLMRQNLEKALGGRISNGFTADAVLEHWVAFANKKLRNLPTPH